MIKKIFLALIARLTDSIRYGKLYPQRGAIDDFGINFHRKVLKKFYEEAITPVITNNQYEGEIKEFGDRLRLLSFLHNIQTSDYTAGTDMGVQTLFDTSEELVINQQKYYNFAIDKVEELFTYGSDIADTLIDNSAKELQRVVDNFTFNKLAEGVAAGNWLGQNARIAGTSTATQASIQTTAAGATVQVQANTATGAGTTLASSEIPDGTLIYAGYSDPEDLGKAIRLTSGTTWATEWYRITAITDSATASVVNWDDATAGFPIPNGDILRGLYGGRDFTTDDNGDGKPTTQTGWGWEFQAAIPTTVTSSNIYEHFTEMALILDKYFVPQTDRHAVVPFSGRTALLQATELQPSGIEMLYTDTIVNGKVARVAGFDVHVTSQGRFSTKVGKTTATGTGSDTAEVAGTTGYCWPFIHKDFCTFAFKWSETRTVRAEKQFTKLYQGLSLYGAKVPIIKRTSGAVLFAQAI